MRNIAAIFPGYGSHYIGMGKKLYDKYHFVRLLFKEASEIMNEDLEGCCFESNLYTLSQIEVAWPAIMLVSVAKYEVFKRTYGLRPRIYAGHSLGEISALVCSNAISFRSALELIKVRVKLIKECERNSLAGFLVVDNVSHYIVNKLIREHDLSDKVSVACINSHRQFALVGWNESLLFLSQKLRDGNAMVTPILGYPPIHSRLMMPIKDDFQEYLKTLEFTKPNGQIIYSANGEITDDPRIIYDSLTKQLLQPVLWRNNIETMIANGINTIIEMGPRRYLIDLNSHLAGARHFYFDEEQVEGNLFHHLTINGKKVDY